jgi:CheY-like chemotaxis protein
MGKVNCLIVEDNETKRNSISKVIEQIFPDNITITVEECVNGALNTLFKNKFDVVFLDMQLPRFKEGNRICLYGGREILDEMERKKSNTPVILISSDENSAKCEKECINCVKFINSSQANWQEVLQKTILFISY